MDHRVAEDDIGNGMEEEMTQTVLITGCSSGLGRAAAQAFSDAGWNVVATMRDPAAWTGPSSDRLIVAALDVGDRTSIEAAVAACTDRFGRIDCVVNNAGQALLSVVEATPVDKARAIFDVNLFGPMQVMQAVLPHFRAEGGGRFVNVSSGSAITPDPFMAIYAASKYAVEGLTEGVRFELAPVNVTVKLVELGHVPTTRIGDTIMANSQDVPVPDAYRDGVDRITAFFTAPPPPTALTEGEVASVIVQAAGDESDTLRHVVGEDARLAAHMRREAGEAEYLRWAASRFG